jgi:hypothetical protein
VRRRAEQYSDELLVGPAIVFRHGADWQRLDHFVSGNPDLPLDTRLAMIRQLAGALDHAHRRHLYHRALAPRSVYVELDGRYRGGRQARVQSEITIAKERSARIPARNGAQ